MNRPIKFRAWLDGKHGELTFSKPTMDYDVTVGPQGGWCNVESGWDIHGEYPSVPLMQFTGLKDTKGVEIYEGDICEVVDSEWPYFKERYYLKRMFIKRTGAEDKLVLASTTGMIEGYFNEKDLLPSIWLEIIGNIHENPELLKP